MTQGIANWCIKAVERLVVSNAQAFRNKKLGEMAHVNAIGSVRPSTYALAIVNGSRGVNTIGAITVPTARHVLAHNSYFNDLFFLIGKITAKTANKIVDRTVNTPVYLFLNNTSK